MPFRLAPPPPSLQRMEKRPQLGLWAASSTLTSQTGPGSCLWLPKELLARPAFVLCSYNIALPLLLLYREQRPTQGKIKATGKGEAAAEATGSERRPVSRAGPSALSQPEPAGLDTSVVPGKKPWGFHCRPWLRSPES